MKTEVKERNTTHTRVESPVEVSGTRHASSNRPDFVTQEHLDFLDELRESGVTNMFGARPYLIEEFALGKDTAGNILTYWMQSFGKADR